MAQSLSRISCSPAGQSRSIFDALAFRIDLYRSRRALMRMDAAGLRDIGVTQAQAEAEARRPFWDGADFR